MEWETSRMAEDGEVEARQVCPHAFYSERKLIVCLLEINSDGISEF